MDISIRLKGLPEIQKKLGAKFLIEPEMEDAIRTIEERTQRQGKGLGAQRNVISTETFALASSGRGLATTTTLNPPRTTGGAWLRKNIGIVRAMAPRVLNKAIARIQARWAA